MRASAAAAWMLCALSLPILIPSASAAPACLEVSVSLTREMIGQNWRFTSTGEAAALVDSDESRGLAHEEARLAAKAALANVKDMPKAPGGELQGVYELRACELNGKIYVTVAVDTASMAAAADLSSAMANSIANSPGPVGSPTPEFDRSKFEQLMR